MTNSAGWPEISKEVANQFALDLAADLTKLVAERLREVGAEDDKAFAYRYAIMQAHLIGIAGAIYACALYPHAQEMFDYFEREGSGIVLASLEMGDLFKEDRTQ